MINEAAPEACRNRLDCLASVWRARLREERWRSRLESNEDVSHIEAEATVAVTIDEVTDYISTYPTTNDQTHFATILTSHEWSSYLDMRLS